MKFSAYLILLLSFVACQTIEDAYNLPPELEARERHRKTNQEIVNEALAIKQLDRNKKNKNQAEIKKIKTPLIKIEERPEVQVWINYFTGRGKKHMKLYLERSNRYLRFMLKVLSRENLPKNLIYVAMIESGFSPVARSSAQAVGYWQFIRSTGKRYGLKINYYMDERRDPLLSTSAAGKYLKDLYELFGSWYLAMSSYNAGEHRVNRAMMRHYTRDFWKLRSKKSLPRETAEYVPKFMAANLIARNPIKYGFTNLKYQEPISFDSVVVRKPVSLKLLAAQLSISYKTLKTLNPKYITSYVPLEEGGMAILRVPKGMAQEVTESKVARSFIKRPSLGKSYTRYKVRWGDSLFALAKEYRTTVNAIRRMNNMSGKTILRANKVIKLPQKYRYKKKTSSKKVSKKELVGGKHRVKKGQNLFFLSKKYNISIAQLKKWNQLKSSTIRPGQMLIIKAPSLPQSTSKIKLTYKIKKGDTLSSIAKGYKIPLKSLLKVNSLGLKSILKVGRSLKIPSK